MKFKKTKLLATIFFALSIATQVHATGLTKEQKSLMSAEFTALCMKTMSEKTGGAMSDLMKNVVFTMCSCAADKTVEGADKAEGVDEKAMMALWAASVKACSPE